MQVFSLLDSFAIQSSKNILITVEACVKRLSGGRACRVSLWRDRETWENMRLVRYRKILHCGIFAAKTKSFPLGSLVEAGSTEETETLAFRLGRNLPPSGG